MNPYAPRQITVLQYIFFIHGAQLGIGILTMPKDLAKIAGTDGWIGILLGWLLAVAASLIIIGIMRKYPNFTIVDLLPRLFGKWAGKLFIFVLILYLGFATMTVLVDTVGILRLWLLPQTPFFYTMMLLLVPILFLIGKGVKTLGRYAELISYASVWVPIALLYSIKEPQFLYLLPVLKEGWGPVLKTVPSTVLSFLGFELAFFLYPYLQKKQFASLGIVIANTLSMMVFMVVTLVAYIVFSLDEIQRMSHPSLSMWRGVEYRFLERIDILFLSFYLFMISTTWMPYMYFTVFSAGKLWAQPNERGYLIAFMLLLVLGVFLYTPSYLEVLQLRTIWGQLGMALGYLVPLLLWGYVHIYDFFSAEANAMRRRLFFLIISLLLAILPGCTDRTDIEDISLTLMAGLDLSEKNELLFYSVSPIFYNEAKKKVEEFGVRADSIREARARLDTLVSALTVGGKIQIIALSKRLVQHPDWYTILDTFYRDPRLTINARIVVVDGPLHEIFHLNPPDKPRLPIHLTQLLDTANRRNLTVKTSALELQRMMNDKGTTPAVTEFKKVNSSVEVMGTALLDERGKYKVRLVPKDTVLFQILKHGKKGELTIVSNIPDHLNKNRWLKPLLSYFVKHVDKKVKTSYQDNQFHFDVELKMEVSITERYFPFVVTTHKKELEQMLEKELGQRYQKLIATFQKHQVDPVGFGVYARAYQYKEWKKVEEDWPKAFAHAKVRIKPIVSIKGFGVIE